MTNPRAIRGRLLSFLRAPRGSGDAQSYRYIEDGIALIKDGRIEAVGPAAELAAQLPPQAPVAQHADALIMPGFIDPHIHYPQTQVIASYGAQLLEWLEEIHLRRGAEIRRSRARRAHGRILPR